MELSRRRILQSVVLGSGVAGLAPGLRGADQWGSRASAAEALASVGTVAHDGRPLNRIDFLPSMAEGTDFINGMFFQPRDTSVIGHKGSPSRVTGHRRFQGRLR
jgi:hypothetical protein